MVTYRKGDMKINTKTHVDDITLVVENNGGVIELIKYAKNSSDRGSEFVTKENKNEHFGKM